VKYVAIAMDGPAASGKSTVAAILAARLGYLYFDTGVMYRAAAWAVLERGVPVDNEAEVTRLTERLDIRVTPPTVQDGRQYTVWCDGVDVTWAIRSEAVVKAVSPVSANPGVRAALTEQQRRIAQGTHVIMVGRDIGTVVLPDAPLKIYLDASPEERARRRHNEIRQRGEDVTYEAVLADVLRRDRYDSSRQTAPLRAAEDAVVIDSTHMSVDEVVATLEPLIRQTVQRACPPENS
jgi:cytidylate kinase